MTRVETAPRPGMLDLRVVTRFVDLASDALAEAREEIDALNVYPVPDGDTGTNLYLTMSAAREALHHADEGQDPLPVLARSALLGARGNSGVILSEMLGAIARRLARATPEERNAAVLSESFTEAVAASYAAVGTPVEGTMLTVARAAAEAAAERAADGSRARDALSAAAAAAREALERTPEQLDVLRHAGVVDAGGRGIVVLLDAAETALTGRRRPPAPRGPLPQPRPSTHDDDHDGPDGVTDPHDDGHDGGHGLTAEGPAYEVMYLLDADDDRIPALRAALAPLGDSLVVVGGEGLWNVHVHVDDVGAAVEAGIEAGRPYRVRVTHFADDAHRGSREQQPREGRAVVAVAAGPGLAALFAECGAVVVEGGPGQRPSAGEILAAITGCGAREVVVLPNDGDSVRVAKVAASTAETDHGLRVTVIPTEAQVQGLAAIAVHDDGRSFDADVLEMTATARHARHGAVTVAAKAALTMAGWCEPGDVLGVIAGDFAIVGKDEYEVAVDVLGRLLGGGAELVTIVGGEDAGDLPQRAAEWVAASHPHVDAVVYDGGQRRYPLLVAVE